MGGVFCMFNSQVSWERGVCRQISVARVMARTLASYGFSSGTLINRSSLDVWLRPAACIDVMAGSPIGGSSHPSALSWWLCNPHVQSYRGSLQIGAHLFHRIGHAHRLAVWCLGSIEVSGCLTVYETLALGINPYIASICIARAISHSEIVGKLNMLSSDWPILAPQRICVYCLS